MQYQLSEATAAQRRVPLYLVDATDGITPETGEAAGQPQLSKNGAAFANTSATLTAIGNGAYYVELTAAELNTIGFIEVRYKSAATAEYSMFYQVVSFDPYDATPPVDVVEWLGTAAATPNTAGVPLIDLVRIVGGLVPTPTTTGVPDVNVERWLDTLVTLGAGAPDVNVASTDDIDLSATQKTSVNTEVDTGLVDARLDELISATAGGVDPVIGSLIDLIMNTGVGQTFSQATDSLEAAADTVLALNDLAQSDILSDATPFPGASITEVRLVELAAANLPADIDTINTATGGLAGAAMRGTDSAALASVLGALADAAVDGDPTATDTVMQYVKQLINVLVGTAGIVTWPAEAAPGNGVSIAEALRANATDVSTTIPGTITTLQSDTDNIQTRLPAALVGGAMDADISAIQAGAITAAAVATDAIDADALATDAVDEIRDAILPTQNVAFNNIMFLLVAASDHVTPVTGATGLAVTRSIDGAAFGAGTGTLAEIANGIYQYDASQADMNGGIITFRFVATGGTPGAADDRFLTVVTGGGV